MLAGVLVSTHVAAQTTEELAEYNAAYLQYGYYLESDPDFAREAARRAYELGRSLFGEDSERTAMLAINYANLLQDEAQSQSYLDEAVTIYQGVFGVGSEELVDPLMRLARTLSDTGKYRLALVYYRRALQLASRHLGEESSKAGSILLELGSIALTDGDVEESFSALEKARQSLRRYDDPGSVTNLARTNLLLGNYYLLTQQPQASLQPLLAALDVLLAYPYADVTLRNRVALIEAYERLGMSASATIHCLAIGARLRLEPDAIMQPLYSVAPQTQQFTGTLGKNNTEGIEIGVSFTVDSQGFVKDPVLMSSVDSDALANNFLQAIRQFRYAPRFANGIAIESPNQQYYFR